MSDSGTFKYSGPGKVPSPTPRSAPFKSSEGMAGEKDKDDYLIGGDGNTPAKNYKKSGKGE